MKSKIAIGLLVFLLSIIVLARVVNNSLFRISSPTGRVNVLVYNGEEAIVIALDKETAHALYFPGNTYIETARGAGKYPVNKLNTIGELSQGEGDFVEASFERFLAIPIDIYILSSRDISSQSISGLVKFIDIVSSKYLDTSINRPSILQLWLNLAGLRVPKENIIDVSKTRTVSNISQADGVEISQADSRFLPVKLQQYFVEIPLAKEKFKFIVYNSVGTPGLARLASDMLENMGTDVILLENRPANVKGCQLHIADQEYEKLITVKRVKQAFNCELIHDTTSEGELVASIYLGETFSKLMFGR